MTDKKTLPQFLVTDDELTAPPPGHWAAKEQPIMLNQCNDCGGHYTEYETQLTLADEPVDLCPVCELRREARAGGTTQEHIKIIRDILDLMEKQHDS